MAVLTPRSVFRRYNVDGVPSSGHHKVIKDEVVQLLEQVFGVSRGGWVVTQTLAELTGVTPENETDGGVVLADPDPAKNGYYQRDSGAWVRGRGFPDTFARVALSGSGAAQTGAVETGVNPADVEVFFAFVGTENDGPLTLAIAGEEPREVLNLAGNSLSAGEWTGVVMFALRDGKYQLLLDAGAAQAAAQSASDAKDEADRAEQDADRADAAADRAENSASSFIEIATNFKTVATFLADETMGYAGSGKDVIVGEGDIVTAQGRRYEVAASGATDAHVETAGGVRFNVLPGAKGFRSYEAFGAVGDGVVDDTVPIAKAHLVGGLLTGEGGKYKITDTINIVAGTVLDLRGCTVKPTDDLTGPAFFADGQDDITVYWGRMEGSGTAFSTGNENLAWFANCGRLKSCGGVFTKARNMGLALVNCDNAYVENPISKNCYGTGLHDRDGSDNVWINPQSIGNGDTGLATYSGGRGLLIWRGKAITVFGGASKGCSEYGLRVYSQSDDTGGSSQIKIIGHHAEDNGIIDFYVYNESGEVSTVTLSDCTVLRSVDASGHPVALQGKNINWVGGSIRKVGSRAAVSTFNLYGLSNSRISGADLINQGQMVSWSGTSPCDNIEISNIIGDISTCGTPFGTNITYRGNKFTHGGGGATDVAIDCAGSTSIVADGNEFDGFWRVINWVAQPITLINNRSRNTTDVSLRMNGDGVAGLVSSGNDWDKNSNPIWVATAHRQGGPHSRLTAYMDSAPTTLTYARGDRMIAANPTVGQPKSRVCTVGGTPGAWESEGNL